MNLIKQLKEEHKRIGYLFEELKTHEDSSIIEELSEVLIAHLELEDRLLYPAFENSKEQELIDLGKVFSKQMKKIAKEAMDFFKKYESKNYEELKKDKSFKKRLKVVIIEITKRVNIEEKVLFPAYETYFKNS